jgi:hypothetical protein
MRKGRVGDVLFWKQVQIQPYFSSLPPVFLIVILYTIVSLKINEMKDIFQDGDVLC